MKPTIAHLKDQAARSIAQELVQECIDSKFYPSLDHVREDGTIEYATAEDIREWAEEAYDGNALGLLGEDVWHEEVMEVLHMQLNDMFYSIVNEVKRDAYEKTLEVLKALETEDKYTFLNE